MIAINCFRQKLDPFYEESLSLDPTLNLKLFLNSPSTKGLKCEVQFEKNKVEHEIIYTGHKQEKADITPVIIFQQNCTITITRTKIKIHLRNN